MRIISGFLGGQNFDSPKGNKTHPMSEKVRGGLFSVLGDINELNILDPFAGSGAIGFEAISRGAKHATLIDIDKGSNATINKNVKQLKIDNKIKAIRANASGWSDNNIDKKFDIIIIDPPYDGLKINLIQKLTNHLRDDGLFVLSWPGNLIVPELTTLKNIKNKNYGDAQLVFYKKVS